VILLYLQNKPFAVTRKCRKAYN